MWTVWRGNLFRENAPRACGTPSSASAPHDCMAAPCPPCFPEGRQAPSCSCVWPMFNASSQVQRWQPGVVDEQATSVLVLTDRVTLAFPSLVRLASDGDCQGPSSATACPDNPGGGGGLCPESPLSTRAPPVPVPGLPHPRSGRT